MSIDLIKKISDSQLKEDRDNFSVGDTVKVHVRIVEGTRERVQIFEGTVIKKQSGGVSQTFTVRKLSGHSTAVERTWPLHSPRIERIEVVRRGVVRRAKLFYLRKRKGKKAKVKEVIR